MTKKPIIRRNQKSLQGFKKLKDYKFNKIRIFGKLEQKSAPEQIVRIVKRSRLIDGVKDQFNESIDVGIKFEDGSSYKINVQIPDDFVKGMLQEATNFIKLDTLVIVVKELREKPVNEVI